VFCRTLRKISSLYVKLQRSEIIFHSLVKLYTQPGNFRANLKRIFCLNIEQFMGAIVRLFGAADECFLIKPRFLIADQRRDVPHKERMLQKLDQRTNPRMHRHILRETDLPC
jgi:hypothetical protein